MSYPPNYKLVANTHNGVTPPPTSLQDAPVLPIYTPFKTASSKLNADDTQQQVQQSQALQSENNLDKPTKGQAARDAYNFTKSKSYISPTQQKVELKEPEEPLVFNYTDLSTLKINQSYVTSLEYTQESTQEAAIRLATVAGTKVGVLNFANARYIGGSAFNGANGQEESLIRTTTLFSSLSHLIDPAIKLEEEVKKSYTEIKYKKETTALLNINNGVLVSQNVSIFRHFNARTNKYEALSAPTVVTVVTSAAINLTHGRPQNYAKITRQKIYSQLAAFAKEGMDSIVLRAWGCGAFGNQAEDIAPIYKSLLENEFKGAFKTVVFAIPSSNLLSIFKSTLNAKGV